MRLRAVVLLFLSLSAAGWAMKLPHVQSRRSAVLRGLPSLLAAAATTVAVQARADDAELDAALAAINERKRKEAENEEDKVGPFGMFEQTEGYKKGAAKLENLENMSTTEKLNLGVNAVRKEGVLASTGKPVPFYLPVAVFAGIGAVLFFERPWSQSNDDTPAPRPAAVEEIADDENDDAVD